MKCSVCRETKPRLIKTEESLLCEACKLDAELQLQRNDVIVRHLVGTQNIKSEPVAMGEEQDQAPMVNLLNGDLNHEIKQELNSDTEDSEPCDTDSEENTSLDDSSQHTLKYEDVQNQEIHIKDELTLEEPKVQNIVNEYTEGEKMSCKLCSFSCANRHLLRKHLLAYHPVERLTGCAICNKKFQGQALYQQHLQEKHDGFGRECKVCLEKFRDRREIKAHRGHCLGRLLFICNSCEKRYASKESVLKHLDGQCSSVNTKDVAFIEKRSKEQFFTCALCDDDRAFEKDPYWRHIKEVHNGHLIRCKYCPATFTLRTTRSRHMKFRCTASDRVVRQDVKCPNCPKIFDTQRKLDRHVKSVHCSAPVSCEVCQKICINSLALKYHRQNDHMKTIRQCPYCPRKYDIYSSYSSHIRTHRK